MRNIQDVTGLDNQTPASPDRTGGHQCAVLGQRELLSWAVEVGNTGDDESPLFAKRNQSCPFSCIPACQTSRSSHDSIARQRYKGVAMENSAYQNGWIDRVTNRTFITGALSDQY